MQTRTALDVMLGVFGAVFGTASRRAWVLAAAAVFGLAHGLSADEQAFLLRCLGRARVPVTSAREAWFVVGRRGGKSHFAAFVAVLLSCFRKYTLAPGERGVFMVIAADRRQGRVVKRYISGLLRSVPMLARLIVDETKEAIELNNGITIEIHTASFRTLRGYTVIGAVCDEIAFWPLDDAANPDAEILTALRPAMATVPGALLVCISSPYAKRGELYRTYAQHFGKDDDELLVWQADTRTMNPTVPASVIERAYEEDEASAEAEYGAQFRSDVSNFLPREAIDAVVVPGRLELPRRREVTYRAFFDAAGGSGSDSQTLAIAHSEQRGDLTVGVLDCVREVRPPFSPDNVVADFATTLQAYGVTRVTADRYAGDWPRERFQRYGISVQSSELSASDIYREVLPLINSRPAELLDLPRLRRQLAGLERKTARGGKDSISHAPGAHDDVAVVAAGVLVATTAAKRGGAAACHIDGI